jgi:hypothetical protein
MKRKPQRVPDFSTAKKPVSSPKGAIPATTTEKVAPAAPRPIAKPQATSSKSGRRGT